MAKRMPRVNLRSDFRRSSAFKVNKLNLSSRALQRDGEYVDKKKLPKRAAISQGTTALAGQGLLEAPSTPQTTDRKSHNVLHAMGYSIEVGKQNFTLVDSTQQFTEMVDYLTDIKPATVEFSKMAQFHTIASNFPDPYNPIYEPDQQTQQQYNKPNNASDRNIARQLDLVNTANQMCAFGMRQTSHNQTSRYWQNDRVKASLKTRNRHG